MPWESEQLIQQQGGQSYHFVHQVGHAAIRVAGRAQSLNLEPAKLDHLVVLQVLVRLGAASLRDDAHSPREQLLEVAGSGDVVRVHVGVHFRELNYFNYNV